VRPGDAGEVGQVERRGGGGQAGEAVAREQGGEEDNVGDFELDD